MKIKSRTKKILVLSIMVVLLVTTGVLNFVLNDKLASATETPGDGGAVIQTFFAAARSNRDATRESEFLYLDAIVNSENSSASAKAAAEEQKMLLVKRMGMEQQLETLIQGKGFEDAIVAISDGGVSVVVGAVEMTEEQANQILDIVVETVSCDPNDVRITPYN